MKNIDKFNNKLKSAKDTETPVTVSVDGVECELHILMFGEIKAMGETGGVLSYFIREVKDE